MVWYGTTARRRLNTFLFRQSFPNIVNVNVEFKVTLHEHLTVLKVTVCQTAGHYGEEYDDWNMQCGLEIAAELQQRWRRANRRRDSILRLRNSSSILATLIVDWHWHWCRHCSSRNLQIPRTRQLRFYCATLYASVVLAMTRCQSVCLCVCHKSEVYQYAPSWSLASFDTVLSGTRDVSGNKDTLFHYCYVCKSFRLILYFIS